MRNVSVSATERNEATLLEAIWAASQDADNPTFRPREGWWSLVSWATAIRLLLEEGVPIGVAAINVTAGREEAEARLALLPSWRYPAQAMHLVDVMLALVREAGRTAVHLYAPSTAIWAITAAQQCMFSIHRTQHVMLRAAEAERLPLQSIEGIQLRQLREGEEPALLEALNRAWAGTWNFRPLTLEALNADLEGQRDGFYIALAEADEKRIIGTIHALFGSEARNPDDQPYAWISNLTTSPEWRGYGLGRVLLSVGLNHLVAKGADSVALGVDGGAIAPMALYRSVGFEAISTVEIWERNAQAAGV